MSVFNRISDRTRPYETIHTTAHEFHSTSELNRHTTNTVSYDRHTTNTVQVRIIHGHLQFFILSLLKFRKFVKPSHQNESILYQNIHECGIIRNSSITRTKVGEIVCKPCKCPVN